LRQPKTIFIVDQYPIQNLPQIEFPWNGMNQVACHVR
jgi:hypothetical protein